jgi:ribosomal protein S1
LERIIRLDPMSLGDDREKRAHDFTKHEISYSILRLAKDNHETVARSKAAEEAQPAVQQQEQIQPKKEGE